MSSASAARAATRGMDSSAAGRAPEDSRSELLIALAVFFCACLFLWPLRDFVLFNADEGIILSDADRILRGQVAYRDFASLYTPGSYYLLALAFRIFGETLAVARSLLLMYCGVFSSVTYLLARRIGSRSAALFAAAMLACGCLPFRFFVLHNWDSTLFALLALYCATRLMEGGSWLWTAALGLSAALTCLTEQARGAGLVLGLVMAGAVMLPRWRAQAIGRAHILGATAGFLLPWMITFGYFASQHAMLEMMRYWLWPLRGYYGDNHVPYGFVSTGASLDFFTGAGGRVEPLVVLFGAPMFLVSALAFMVVLSSAYWLIRYRRAEGGADLRVLGGCTFFGIWLSTLATSRADFSHILYIAPLFAYLLPSLLDIDDRRVGSLYALRPVIAGVLLLSFAGFGCATILKAAGPATRLQTRRGEIRAVYDDQVIPYVEARLAEGQPMLVYPYQPLYSFLAGTLPASRFDGILRPAPELLGMMVEDLSRNPTAVVLLDRTFTEKAPVIWPSIPLGALASDPIGDYIVKHYHSCKVLNLNPPQAWIFDFMVRDGVACPVEGK